MAVAVVLGSLFALHLARACLSQALGAPSDNGGSGFSLVSQALQARLRLTYQARQDIFWTTPSSAEGVTQLVVDIARAGRRAQIIYRFPPEAAGRVMLDDGKRSSLYDPAHQALIVGPSAGDDQRAASPATLALLRRNYVSLLLRRESLNGLACAVVQIQPRGEAGPSKRLWIDTARHAILRTEEYDAEGCRRYVSFYEAIRFPLHLPAKALALPDSASGPAIRRVSVSSQSTPSARQAFAMAGLTGRVPAWCPRGYNLMYCAVTSPRPGDKAVLLHYSDGLKSLVVMEEARTGGQLGAAELNRSLSHYGQQAWVHEESRLRMVVRGDLSLPEAVGAELVRALDPGADAALARGLARDFGGAAAKRGAALRCAGWGYEQIGALLLGEKRSPRLRALLKTRMGRDTPWPQVATLFGTEAPDLERRARTWVASTLSVAH